VKTTLNRIEFRMRTLAALFVAVIVAATPQNVKLRDDPGIEPWLYLHGGSFTGAAQPLSPDPLVAYQWSPTVNSTPLQIYDMLPVSLSLLQGTSPSSFVNLDSLIFPATNASVTVTGPGAFVFDIATESAAWLEFDSPDLQPRDAALISLSFAEWADIPLKNGPAVAYGRTYRLETNPALYEGVRYGWFNLSATPSQPFTITGLRAVSQAKPVNYTGVFSAAGDELLTRIWYTAVYTVRLNLEESYFGAILVDRGDRISWTGDAHVAQAASMAAFDNYAMVLQNLALGATNCNGIESYCVYWCLSVVDYFHATNDTAALATYQPFADSNLEHAQAIFGDMSTGLSFFGWDDRVGTLLCNLCRLSTSSAL
jgi:alpha-L-rhamnosidase